MPEGGLECHEASEHHSLDIVGINVGAGQINFMLAIAQPH